jgi:hypothetical protein
MREEKKLLEKNIRKTHKDIGTRNEFLTRIPIAQKIRTGIEKWDCIKLKSFYTAKEALCRIKRKSIEWEKIFVVIH